MMYVQKLSNHIALMIPRIPSFMMLINSRERGSHREEVEGSRDYL